HFFGSTGNSALDWQLLCWTRFGTPPSGARHRDRRWTGRRYSVRSSLVASSRTTRRDFSQLSKEHYAYNVLHRLRRQVLVSLREILQLPEVYR
ncbi:hypothetical protein E2562_007805, partial [Oryza meyeriana var. granulata]